MGGFIRVDSVLNLKPLDNLIGFAQRYPQYVRRASQSAFQMSKPALLKPLQTPPVQRAVHPYVWSTDPAANARGRRAYFALVKAGIIQTDDYGSIRTGALEAGYDANLFIDGADIFIEVTNSESRAYRYTKGKRQTPGNALTGWEKDAPIITAWVSEFRTSLIGELNTVAQALGSPA